MLRWWSLVVGLFSGSSPDGAERVGATGDTGSVADTGSADTGLAPSQPRAIVLVVDMSCSMMGSDPTAPVQWARAGTLAFLDTLEQTPRAGDMVGLAMFAEYAVSTPTPGWPNGRAIQTNTPPVSARPWAPLWDVETRGAASRRLFRGVCDTMQGTRCQTADAPDYEIVATGGTWAIHPTRALIGATTNPQPALLQGVNELLDKTDSSVYRGIVFLSDGVPNVGGGTGGAILAVDEAWRNDIHVWSVLFDYGFGDPTFMQSLVRGDGTFLSTAVAEDLPDLYRDIALALP